MMQYTLLNEMMVFFKVAELSSFTDAAKVLRLSKGAVSKQITQLEETLGMALLQRTTRKIALTEAGQLLYEHCQHVADAVGDAQAALSTNLSSPHGTLRISSPNSFAAMHLAPAIVEFMKLYPQIQVEVFLGGAYEDLMEHALDVGIRIGSLSDSSLKSRLLAMRGFRVCGSPEYFKIHEKPEIPEELKNHNCLLHLSSPTGKEWHFDDDGKKIRTRVSGRFCSTNSSALLSAALGGLGLVMLPGYLTNDYLKRRELISVLGDYLPKNIGIYAVYPSHTHTPLKVRVFIDFLAERFGEDRKS